MSVLRATLFHTCFWVWTIFLGAVAFPAWLSSSITRKIARLWVRITLWLLRVCCGLSVQVRGLEHKSEQPCIYAAKHQSTLDTLMLWYLLDGPAFILKRQLLWLPIFGWYLARTQPIAINRAAGSKMLPRIVSQGKQRIEVGRNIIIFPEGTRTKPGADTHYRMAGVSALYDELDVAIVPVALNTGLFWPKRQYTKRAGEAVIEFLPPIKPGVNVDKMAEQLKTSIEGASRALL